MVKKLGIGLVALIVLVSIIGSFGGSEEATGTEADASPSPSASIAPSASPSPSPSLALAVEASPTADIAEAEDPAPSRCEDVPQALVAAISEGLTIDGGGSIVGAQAVRSGDYKKAWFVAADLEGPGLEDAGPVAVWTTNDLQAAGMIFSVNSYANEFSDWGDGRKTDAGFSMRDDGFREAVECVG